MTFSEKVDINLLGDVIIRLDNKLTIDTNKIRATVSNNHNFTYQIVKYVPSKIIEFSGKKMEDMSIEELMGMGMSLEEFIDSSRYVNKTTDQKVYIKL